MTSCFTTDTTLSPVPVTVILEKEYAAWYQNQSGPVKQWLTAMNIRGKAGELCSMPSAAGTLAEVICIIDKPKNFWCLGQLSTVLPPAVYQFKVENKRYQDYALAWGLGAYQFKRYKTFERAPATLFLPAEIATGKLYDTLKAIYLVRDLINTPTDDMGPSEFAAVTAKIAKQYGANLQQIVGEDLLSEKYACIYTVGRASDDAPRLLDLTWGDESHPKVTLVGKGVCFDSGGLDLKAAPYMLLMKKDMGGAAHVLGLATMIMSAKLKVRLRVLMPVLENVISGNAYRPGDVIKSRSGKTIEVGNTDAEGRLILADALTTAVSDNPALIIDIATLTGAARVAVGTDIACYFANQKKLAESLQPISEAVLDPMWPLPLYTPYRDYICSSIADLNNNPSEPYGGAITAALFLKEFVPDQIPWLHFDIMAWNLRPRPGHPVGGEAMGLRALFHYLEHTYQ